MRQQTQGNIYRPSLHSLFQGVHIPPVFSLGFLCVLCPPPFPTHHQNSRFNSVTLRKVVGIIEFQTISDAFPRVRVHDLLSRSNVCHPIIFFLLNIKTGGLISEAGGKLIFFFRPQWIFNACVFRATALSDNAPFNDTGGLAAVKQAQSCLILKINSLVVCIYTLH